MVSGNRPDWKGTTMRLLMGALTVALLLLAAGCILNEDSKDGYTPGWKRTGLPSSVKGTWYRNGYEQLVVTSRDITMDNRTWPLHVVEKKAGEYRAIVNSVYQYRAIYFTSITGSAMQVAGTEIGYTAYDVATADHGTYFEVNKQMESVTGGTE